MIESLQGVNKQELRKLIQESFLSQKQEFYMLEFLVTLITVSNQTIIEKGELFFQIIQLFQLNELAQDAVSEELVLKLLQFIYLKNGGNAKQVSDLYGLTFQSQVPYLSKAVFQLNPEKQDSFIDVTGFFQQLQCFFMESKNSKDIFLDDTQLLRDLSVHLSHFCDIRQGGFLSLVVATDVSIKKTKIQLKCINNILQISPNKNDDNTYQNKYDSKLWKQNQNLLVIRNNYQMINKDKFQNILQKMPLIEYFLNHGVNQSPLEIINSQIIEFKVQIDGQDLIKMCLKNNNNPSLDYSEYYEQFLLSRWKRYDNLISEQQLAQSKYEAQVWCLEMQNLCYHQSIQQIERKIMLKILEKIINPLEKIFEGTLKDNKKNINRIDGQFWYLAKKMKTVNMNSINYESQVIVDDKTRIIDRQSSVLDNIFHNNKIVNPTFVINYRSRLTVNPEIMYQNWAIFKYFDLKKQWMLSKLTKVSDTVYQVQFQKYPQNKYLLKNHQVALAINLVEKQIIQNENQRSKIIQSQKLSFMEISKLEFVEYDIEEEEVAFKPLYTISNRKNNESKYLPISVASYYKDLNDRSSLQNEGFNLE